MKAPVAVGENIKGKYRVERVLGEGGMGVVVAAQHLALDVPVAIKFLHTSMLEHTSIVERFAREARAASKIQSEHVARVTDVDTLDDGTPFMVMEYLEGSDLSSVGESGTPLPQGVAVRYILEACEAIGEAHRRGIVHRDIKPANIFVAKRDDGRTTVKVLDFGISKLEGGGSTDPSLTGTTATMGSAFYMSPEQIISTRDVDSRSDIWALGITLYELLTARMPFDGESITQIYVMSTTTKPVLPSAIVPGLPPELDAVILRCLQKDRADRYASVADLASALAPFAQGEWAGRPSFPLDAASGQRRGEPTAALAKTAARNTVTGVELPGSTSWQSAPTAILGGEAQVRPKPPQRSMILGIVAAAALAVGVGGVALVLKSHDAPAASGVHVAATPTPDNTVAPPAATPAITAGPIVAPVPVLAPAPASASAAAAPAVTPATATPVAPASSPAHSAAATLPHGPTPPAAPKETHAPPAAAAAKPPPPSTERQTLE